MWKTIVLLELALVLTSSNALPQRGIEKELYPFESGTKCGYVDKKGEIIVVPQFENCRTFEGGMAGVSISKKVGYIDGTGQIVIPLIYEGNFPESFSEGFATVELRDKDPGRGLGYVDTVGEFRRINGVVEIFSFREGLAKIKKNGNFGFIDKTFRIVIYPQYKFAGSFGNGLARVSYRPGEDFFIDKNGKRVFTAYGMDVGDFSDGLASFRDKYHEYGYLDTSGQIVIRPRFSYPCFFKNGLACAELDGKWGYIDKRGIFRIAPQFEEAEDFSSDGIAVVKVRGKFGFIDKSGEFIINPEFEEASWINGLGLVKVGDVKKYIDNHGQTIFTMRKDIN